MKDTEEAKQIQEEIKDINGNLKYPYVSDEFKEAVKEDKIRRIRIICADIMLISYKEYKNFILYDEFEKYYLNETTFDLYESSNEGEEYNLEQWKNKSLEEVTDEMNNCFVIYKSDLGFYKPLTNYLKGLVKLYFELKDGN